MTYNEVTLWIINKLPVENYLSFPRDSCHALFKPVLINVLVHFWQIMHVYK